MSSQVASTTMTTTFAEFVRQHGQQDGSRLRTCYDEPQEHAAEMLATLLISHIDADTDTIPQTICEMYGYGSHV